MAKIVATFTFHSGVRQNLFQNVRLSGSWDANGIFSNQWTQTPMVVSSDETGCDAFTASVSMDASQVGTRFEWGVIADLASAQNSWVVVTEVADPNSAQQTRSFILSAAGGRQDYWFATGRRFGAQKYTPTGATKPGIRFSVWAPFAQSVEVVFAPFPAAPATPSGYIADDGTGVDPTASVVPLTQIGTTGIWETSVTTTPALADFSAFMNRLYMYRIVNEQHGATYKVDIFSRNQVGRGNNNPNGAQYAGSYLDLDGIVSCSVVSDPDLVTQDFDDAGVEKQSLIPADEFWANDLNPAKPLPLAIARGSGLAGFRSFAQNSSAGIRLCFSTPASSKSCVTRSGSETTEQLTIPSRSRYEPAYCALGIVVPASHLVAREDIHLVGRTVLLIHDPVHVQAIHECAEVREGWRGGHARLPDTGRSDLGERHHRSCGIHSRPSSAM